MIFPVLPEELGFLASRDKKLGNAITLIGPLERKCHPGILHGLMHAITGQQIGGKAHQSIWNRFTSIYSPDKPKEIGNASLEALRACGLSQRKADYIRNLAQLFYKGALDEQELFNMEDVALREILLGLPGIGPWTVDMLLIFTFKRKNILSRGDLGIQRGLRMLYGHRALTPALFERYQKRYAPFASIASFYLWEIASSQYPHWREPVSKK